MLLAIRLLQATARAATIVCPIAILVAAMAEPAWARVPIQSPEIDPGSVASAITLFAAGTMYLSSRRRMK